MRILRNIESGAKTQLNETDDVHKGNQSTAASHQEKDTLDRRIDRLLFQAENSPTASGATSSIDASFVEENLSRLRAIGDAFGREIVTAAQRLQWMESERSSPFFSQFFIPP